MPFAALVAVFILPLIPLLFPPSCPSLPTFEINLKIVVAFCGSFFPLPPPLSRSHYGTNRLKNAPKRIRFHVDYTLFLSLHCTCFLFFAFPSLSLFLFGQNSKITWPQQSGKLCQVVFSTFYTPPAYAVYLISQERGQLCPNASASRIRPADWLAQMMRWKWNILSWSEKWTNQGKLPQSAIAGEAD